MNPTGLENRQLDWCAYKDFCSDRHSACLACNYLLLTYKSNKVTCDNLLMSGKIKGFSIIVSTICTRLIKPRGATDSYQCGLFHLHKIQLCTCSYRIRGCCYTQHQLPSTLVHSAMSLTTKGI